MTENNETEMVKLSSWAEEKIGLANYSNVTVGGSIARYVPNGDRETIANELRNNFELVEEIVAEQRQAVLESLQESVKK